MTRDARDVDVLVVGAGPTGLMMACQLARHGVRFRIVDAQVDRAHESRAFAIQARSMEIFDDLGLAEAFLARVRRGDPVHFAAHGHERTQIRFDDVLDGETPFPGLYLLEQPRTEQLLLDHLAARGITVERPVELRGFAQDGSGVVAELVRGDRVDSVRCRYLVGCDGAHSRVRDVLGIPFAGATYEQEFVLADCTVDWPFPHDHLRGFLGRDGVLIHVPLEGGASRVMGATLGGPARNGAPPTLDEVAALARAVTGAPVELSAPRWLSRFHFHHRVVARYREGRAFLAGDACHIHTPVGGQGMNTGMQDATNLAWKLALVLAGAAPVSLLDTYHAERHRVGEVLVHTTDRAFGAITNPGPIMSLLRDLVVPVALPWVGRSRRLRARLVRFVSQLAIRYHASDFVAELADGADGAFRAGPPAGCRAPRVSLGGVSLADLQRQRPIAVLLFGDAGAGAGPGPSLAELERRHAAFAVFHRVPATDATELAFQRFGVHSSAVYVVRPDGYIGFRAYGPSLAPAADYLQRLLGASPAARPATAGAFGRPARGA